jgi:capping protein alpha
LRHKRIKKLNNNMGEPTEAELLQIANNFILSAPPGEFGEVVADVRGLLQNDELLNQNALETFKKYNNTQMIQVQNGDHQALVCTFGELGNNEYLDPSGGQVFKFDHVKQKVVSSRPISGELDSSVENFRKAIDTAIQEYVSNHYPTGTAAVYSGKEGSEMKITIAISSCKFSPTNFWGGRWRGVWILKFKPGGDLKLDGTIKVQVHYYEDGNVQLTTNFSKSSSIKAPSDGKALAEAALKQISKLEQDYHTALEHSYNTMGETTFKALRRVLPITRERIKWEKIRNYRIGGEVGK